MPFATIKVTGIKRPATLLADYGEICTLVNSDAAITITLGHDNTVQPGDINSAPLGAGQVMSTDGSSQVYGINTGVQSAIVLKFPGVVFLSGIGPSPTITPPMVAVGSIGSGNTTDLIGGTGNNNPNNLSIQLLTVSISSFVSAGSVGSGFNVQDAIIDNQGGMWFQVQNGLPSSSAPQLSPVNLWQDMKSALVPAGRKLQLSNGSGAGSALHQCSATVVYYLVGS